MSEANMHKRDLRQETAPLRAQILDRLSQLPWDGVRYSHSIPGLVLYRVTGPTGPFSSVSEPSLSLILKGSKRVKVGNETLLYDESCFFVTAIGLPMTGQICEASEGEPYVAATLRLDLEKLRRIITDYDIQPTDMPERDLGVVVGAATPELFDALLRLISLVNSPADIPFLANHVQNEILYRLLTGEQGARLRRFALTGTNSNRVAKAVAWLKENYARPLRIEELAEVANMGVSTLHHHFRAMTAMSPLQFQKHLRLHHARELMLSQSLDAATAATRVGYESPTQFSREYRRAFGHPPIRDIRSILNSSEANRRDSID
ncbi:MULTISPECIES: AraC family transcriptional regulator [unclassified Sinorhizobium]|uniref:AraC family transcriptional regulator n=1 Tax=unclassified Sinorhizobium TaxID=2613772 RepID=UPI0024C46204|nr:MULTISPECIES: AraC family transcriptional regulator [unclassified Sinorhizobium]MDK1377398.1 AraC family transcriptional regulator [Sinorhizobium sp. 6-70]MDK1478888.1 AraC family transcriptional regulator [Sinorhizobium sp. 6-117]